MIWPLVLSGLLSALEPAQAEARMSAIGDRLATAGVAICPLRTPQPNSAAERCRSRLRLVETRRVRAAANGADVTVTTGLLEFTRNDDELAFVLAHEIAHNAWGHAALLARPDGKRFRRATELEADANALKLMRAAGYDVRGVVAFLERLYDGPAGGLFKSAGHLGRRERIRALQAELQSTVHSRLLPRRNSRSAESINSAQSGLSAPDAYARARPAQAQ